MADLVRALSDKVNVTQERLLPLGIGLTSVARTCVARMLRLTRVYSVNIPTFGPGSNCSAVRTRECLLSLLTKIPV